MNPNFKENERELVKLVHFFRKKAGSLISEGKLGEEHEKMITACDSLVEKLEMHANNRNQILQQREQLKTIVKDNASCPKCDRDTHLKKTGTDRNEYDWVSNKYICKRCNIEFVWNRPNNPWDLLSFMEKYIAEVKSTAGDEIPEEQILQAEQSLATLRPVLEASDKSFEELQAAETEMDKMIQAFRKHLMIEKIKMTEV